MTGLAELLATLRAAGAGPAQLAQEERNWKAAQEWAKKPRGERALPAAAFSNSKRARNKDAVAFWSTPPEERKAEPTEADLRKAISAEHRKLSAEGGDPGKLQTLLKKRRGK